MERVQYSLERTLPQLKLLDEHAILSKEELRSVTSQRQDFEARLIRRQAEKSDFVRYLDFETDLNSLIVLRSRSRTREAAERVRAGDEDARSRLLPRTFFAKQAASYSAQCVAIFERLVRKFRWDVDAWIRYLSWAKSRKMRVVAGRVYARALALHPSRPDLWLSAADYELNSHADTTAARALLQRGLRMNTIVDAQAQEAHDLKRARTNRGTRAAREPGALRWQLTDYEQDVLRLWVEYMRMELVFMERLRRRWRVLGLDSGDSATSPSTSFRDAQRAAQSVAPELLSDDEEAAAAEAAVDADVPAADSADEASEGDEPSRPEPVQPAAGIAIPPGHQQIMSGSIPLVVLANAQKSLPPSVQLYFYVALLELFSAFPFFDSTIVQVHGHVLCLRTSQGTCGSGDRLRARLMQRVLDAMQQMDGLWEPAGALAAYVMAGVYPLYHSFSSAVPTPQDDSARPVSQAERELADNAYLHGASQLCATHSPVIDGLYELAAVPESLRLDKTASGLYDPWHACRPVLFLLQVLSRRLVRLDDDQGGASWHPSPYLAMLIHAGDLPSLVQACVAQFRQAEPTDESRMLAFRTTLQFLRTSSRSGIDEPHLLAYLERVRAQPDKDLAGVPWVALEDLAGRLTRGALSCEDAEALATTLSVDPRAWLLYVRAAQKKASHPFFGSWSKGEAAADAAHQAWIAMLTRCTQVAQFQDEATASVWGWLSAWACTPATSQVDVSYVSPTAARCTLWMEYLDQVQKAASAAPLEHAREASEWAWALGKEAVHKTGAVLASAALTGVARAHAQALHDAVVSHFVAWEAPGPDAALTHALSASSASVSCWLHLAEQEAEQSSDSAHHARCSRLYQRAIDQAERERDVAMMSTTWLAYLDYVAHTRRDMATALRELATATTRVRALGGDAAAVALEAAWRARCAEGPRPSP